MASISGFSNPVMARPDAVPVVPASPARLAHAANAHLLVCFAFFAQLLVSMTPGLLAAFPQARWLPPLLGLLGSAWRASQHSESKDAVQPANYTPAAPSP